MIGDSGVGKTNVLLRFVGDDFNKNHLTTIGIFNNYFHALKKYYKNKFEINIKE